MTFQWAVIERHLTVLLSIDILTCYECDWSIFTDAKAYFRKFWLWIIDALIFDCGLAWHVSYLHVKGLLPRTKQSNIYTVLCFEIKWLIYWLIDWTIRSYDGSATWNLLYLHSEITNYLVLNHKSVSLAMLQCGCDCAL